MGKSVNNTKRINWIDMARGYGVILVIIGHITYFGGTWDHLLIGEIYSFHIPLFFIISGFLLSAMKYSPEDFVLKRLKGIMLPYLWLGLAIVAINWAFYDLGDIEALGYYFLELIAQRRFHVIWYLTCLFVAEICFYGVVRLLNNCLWQIGIICTLLAGLGLAYYHTGGQPLPWNVDVVPMAMFFLFVGYAIKNIDIKKDTRYLVIAIVVNLACVAGNEILVGKNLEMFGSQYAIVPFTLLASLAGVYFIYWISCKKQFKPIEYIGKNSLVYFGLHQAFTIPGCQMAADALGWFPNKANFIQGFTFTVITTVLSLLAITPVSLLVNWIKSKIKTSD